MLTRYPWNEPGRIGGGGVGGGGEGGDSGLGGDGGAIVIDASCVAASSMVRTSTPTIQEMAARLSCWKTLREM